MKIKAGFTLMELLITVVIIAVLAVLAIPVYNHYIVKSRRTDAINTLLAIQLAQEQYRNTHTTYGNLGAVWNGATTSNEGYYSLTITNLSSTSYTITAIGTGSQTTDSSGSTSCATMTLTYSNGTTTKTPAVCWR